MAWGAVIGAAGITVVHAVAHFRLAMSPIEWFVCPTAVDVIVGYLALGAPDRLQLNAAVAGHKRLSSREVFSDRGITLVSIGCPWTAPFSRGCRRACSMSTCPTGPKPERSGLRRKRGAEYWISSSHRVSREAPASEESFLVENAPHERLCSGRRFVLCPSAIMAEAYEVCCRESTWSPRPCATTNRRRFTGRALRRMGRASIGCP